jgi:UDP-N-acetylglucosamine--N-acetylmuramyl-(pentapeptide) pyrophosphoryl-undecaprenol N-acetylglucosamine transferase
MKILLTGGGTLGSVSPLLAIYEEAKKQGKHWSWFWVGTRHGTERKVVESLDIKYEWVPSAKFRRYTSLQNLVDPFLLIASFLRCLFIIMNTKPDIIIGAGSFIGVPVIWAGWLFRKKIIIHQQDIRPTFSNKLTAFCSTKITTSFEKSLEDYKKEKSEWVGNPVRNALLNGNPEIIKKKFKLNDSYPTLLVTGGSSGAKAINEWVWSNLRELTGKINLIHLTGQGKQRELKRENYHQLEFLHGDMFHALACADVVLTRAGISTLTELAYLEKPAILVPMPLTHQEDNAAYFASQHAARMYRQDQLDDRVVRQVKELLSSEDEREKLSKHIGEIMKKGGRERMVEIIESLSPRTSSTSS